jgi:UDP-N-acetylglucosamine/UDP-N-acetylgalactosamine diphosphorylase
LNSEQYALPFHIAQKAIPCLDAEGTLVQPDEKNGLKFEKFVFDALSRARATAVMEVVREKEFAPIKNAEGEDSPATARELMVNLWAQWLEEAGVRVPRDAAGNVDGAIEISPLFALDANELKRKLPEGFAADPPLYLGPE